MEHQELRYYDANGDEQTIKLHFLFVTPALRVKLVKTQIKLKAKAAAVQEKIAALKASVTTEAGIGIDVGITPEIEEQLSVLDQSEASKMYRESLLDIINMKKLSEKDEALIKSPAESEFWLNVDQGQVIEILQSFREKYPG